MVTLNPTLNLIECFICKRTPEQVGQLYYVTRPDTNLATFRCVEHIETNMPPATTYSTPYVLRMDQETEEKLKEIDPRAMKILDTIIQSIKESTDGFRWFPTMKVRTAVLRAIERELKA